MNKEFLKISKEHLDNGGLLLLDQLSVVENLAKILSLLQLKQIKLYPPKILTTNKELQSLR